jgi:hypothetical protein
MSETAERVIANVVTGENRAEFMAKKLGLVDKVEDAKVIDPEPKEPEPEHAEAHKKPKIEQRFSELTQQRKAAEEAKAAAEARAEAAEKRAKELEEKTKPVVREPIDPEVGPKPNPSEYTDNQKYWEDLSEWSAKNAIKEDRKTQAAEAAKRAAEEVIKAHRARVVAAKAELPDYDDVLASANDLTVSDAVRDSLLESDHSARMLYHLATHREEVAKINQMGDRQALKYLGRLETQFDKQPEAKPAEVVVKPAKLPEPITPIRSTAVKTDDRIDAAGEFTGTYSQWKALRKAGKI